ncbi:histone-lysine N-methyltransferase SETMAR-like protein [Trichonephila clavipes]|uniref:Histone-lysine N-methyltransferase SETMAR-like protein n=1 Tax=Trichonephila clavipes TaxID=2585209 RepID=A0A8X6R812_TRICX|nr:histone-lysine N-methyltransferase SETMAR-like protein [Trichonephila clavipes]
MMGRISICEALTKRDEIDPFLKRMVTGEEKWITYTRQYCAKTIMVEAAQTVAKPRLTSRKIIKMECEVQKNDHFRHLFAFNRGSKAARKILNVDGESAVAERTARDWYVKFINGYLDLKDAPYSGR